LIVRCWVTFFLSYIFFGCITAQTTACDYKIYYYKNGQKLSEGCLVAGKPEGCWKTYYENGNLKSIGKRLQTLLDSVWTFYSKNGYKYQSISYKNGMRNGYFIQYDSLERIIKRDSFQNDVLNGASVMFHQNLKYKTRVVYKNGKREGPELEWNEDSILQRISWYTNDVLQYNDRFNAFDADKKKQGIWKTFYTDFTLKEEKRYNRDSLDGYVKLYDLKGNLKKIKKYNNGNEVLNATELANVSYYKSQDSLGLITYEGVYSEGVALGTHYSYCKYLHCDSVQEYTPTGFIKKQKCVYIARVDSAFEYTKGLKTAYGKVDSLRNKTGAWTELHVNGTCRSMGIYQNGNRIGHWTFYYPNGTTEQSGMYDKKGRPQGLWQWFYESGKLFRTEYFKNGKRDGDVIDYNEDGSVISKTFFLDNVRQGYFYFKNTVYYETGKFTNDLEDSVWVSFYTKTQSKRFEGRYINGEPEGTHRYFYDNGKLAILAIYKNGLKDGTWLFYNKEGDLYLTIQYKNDEEMSWQGKKINTEGLLRERNLNNNYNSKL
jgi:antitoxin component YwqK of YwqJK toxin-antitoxin module